MAAKHILACIDFSEHSTRALREVGEYARANSSKVTLIYISDPQGFIPPQAVLEPASKTDDTAHVAELAKLRDEYLSGLTVELAV
ncbi:MAG: universal stress protein, partial [Polyangiales bacterium]